MNTATASNAPVAPVAQMGPRLSRLAEMDLADHVQMVHNALDAVQCLVMPRGVSDNGAWGDMHFLAQGGLSDLLEIINDRLAIALEKHESRLMN